MSVIAPQFFGSRSSPHVRWDPVKSLGSCGRRRSLRGGAQGLRRWGLLRREGPERPAGEPAPCIGDQHSQEACQAIDAVKIVEDMLAQWADSDIGQVVA